MLDKRKVLNALSDLRGCLDDDGNLWVDKAEVVSLIESVSEEDKLTLELSEGKCLVAERNLDPDYKEISITLERYGSCVQDLAIVGENYEYKENAKGPVPREGEYNIFVYSDKNNEDYTHKFTVGEYEE